MFKGDFVHCFHFFTKTQGFCFLREYVLYSKCIPLDVIFVHLCQETSSSFTKPLSIKHWGFGVALIGAARSKIQHECRCILMFKRGDFSKIWPWTLETCLLLPQDTFLFFSPLSCFFFAKKRHTTSHLQKNVQSEHPKHRDTVRMFFLGMFLDV